MKNYHEKIPEFDVFKRIEKLEEEMMVPDKVVELISDLLIIILLNSAFTFWAFSLHEPNTARKIKDKWVEILKHKDVNKFFVDRLSEILTEVCTIIEQEYRWKCP